MEKVFQTLLYKVGDKEGPIISFGADPNDVIKLNKLGHVSDNVEAALY